MSDDNTVRQDIGEDLSYPVIWEIGIVFALLCIVITVYLYGLFLRVDQAEEQRKLVDAVDPVMVEAVQGQINEINKYGWSVTQDGMVSIPIDQSMKTVAEELTVERYQHERAAALTTAGNVEAEDTGSSVEEDEN